MSAPPIKVPRALAGVMPVVIVPLLSTLVVGAVKLVVVGKPIASAQSALTDGLEGLSGSNAVVLGLLPGPDDGLLHGWPGQQGGPSSSEATQSLGQAGGPGVRDVPGVAPWALTDDALESVALLLDLSELLKAGGSAKCCTLELRA